MATEREHFLEGVELFNRGEFFEAHEEMEEAMNLTDERGGDFDFYRGLLRAAVANHKLSQGETQSAILHLRAALDLLAAFPDRHHNLCLRELRHALSVQLDRLRTAPAEGAARAAAAPRIEMLAGEAP